jgi:CRP/FNR family cyclic AMP-dependent transcriptional regulator
MQRSFNPRTTPVRLLEADPDLGQDLDGPRHDAAKASLVALTEAISPGVWEPQSSLPASSRRLGVLVLDGLMIRDVAILQSTCAELVGRGDVLHPWDDLREGAPVQPDVRWQVLEPAEVAILDDRFIRSAGPYPEVIAALVLRAVARSQSLAVSLAISCVRGLKLRLTMLLWHLADRWGRVGRDGVSVPLVLTHHMLGRLVGATRPSVSATLKELEREGAISKRPEGGWILRGEPPIDLRRSADRVRSRGTLAGAAPGLGAT